MEIGTWHGGDWKGLTGRLDYLADLGVTALWISPIVEQVHGWVGGGSGDFKHYGYHGYWALDFTRLDANLGTLDDLKALVDGAHQRGIRVLADVVLNHPGYATGADLTEYLPEVWKDGSGAAFASYDQTATARYNEWNDLVNYGSAGWANWWGRTWVRAGLPGYPSGGSTDETRQLTFLPDFITEGGGTAAPPVLFTRKDDTGFAEVTGATVRQYLVKWHADWVAQVGFDGFRVDTAKNVDKASMKALKDAGVVALAQWKQQNPGKKIDDAPFWMVGEVFPHGVVKDSYFTDGGFDSLINFDLQTRVGRLLVAQGELPDAAVDLEAIYADMADALIADPSLQVLSYLSSHDTRLNFSHVGNDSLRQRHAGTALLLAPGGVQIFYGDESGREAGPAGSDNLQGTRSDMNFGTTDAAILAHWKKVGSFRKKHPAVGGGAHAQIPPPDGTYVFSRKRGDDTVVVVIARSR
jgi:alpha-amylase